MMRMGNERLSALLADLNEPQREAVTHTDGPLLILAGPGSGKTRVVTRRAAYLSATVARPWQILAITFTNKAAREMRERIEALGVGEGMTVCTFHALCAKLLRVYHDRAGVVRDFTIFDRDDRRKLIKRAVEESHLPTRNFTPAGLERIISRAKNDMLTPERFEATCEDWYARTVAGVYHAYEALLAKMGGLDFDDLLMRMAQLLQRDPDLCTELEGRYPYVLIDEYQDTNASQYLIARLMTQGRRNLCATGDPDQSIYGWRGADIENILRFERDYPDARVVRLEQNYRSTRRILSAADRLIARNEQRKDKSLWTDNAEGTPICVREFDTAEEEADWIAEDIDRLRGEGISPGGVAVFYRINALSRALEEAMIARGIPYQIARGVEFYNRKEIKDVLAYVRVLINPQDEVSLLRILNTPPRGIGATSVSRLREQADARGSSLFELITGEADLSFLGRSAEKVRTFGSLLQSLRAEVEQPPATVLERVMRLTGLKAYYGGEGEADSLPLDNLRELVAAAQAFQEGEDEATLRDWLEHTALVSDVDTVDDSQERVTLMTLHAAKGLEFPVVYIVGLEEGMLPLRRRDEDVVDLEEERRLLFVGMTRAKERLTLTLARYRMLRGSSERTSRSSFLDELSGEGVAIEWPDDETGRASSSRPRARGCLPPDFQEWTVGCMVRDPVYGLGQVRSIRRGRRRTHVEVQFQDGSQRCFALEFSALERVDFDEVGEIG